MQEQEHCDLVGALNAAKVNIGPGNVAVIETERVMAACVPSHRLHPGVNKTLKRFGVPVDRKRIFDVFGRVTEAHWYLQSVHGTHCIFQLAPYHLSWASHTGRVHTEAVHTLIALIENE